MAGFIKVCLWNHGRDGLMAPAPAPEAAVWTFPKVRALLNVTILATNAVDVRQFFQMDRDQMDRETTRQPPTDAD
jgi:hypothetical protein